MVDETLFFRILSFWEYFFFSLSLWTFFSFSLTSLGAYCSDGKLICIIAFISYFRNIFFFSGGINCGYCVAYYYHGNSGFPPQISLFNMNRFTSFPSTSQNPPRYTKNRKKINKH